MMMAAIGRPLRVAGTNCQSSEACAAAVANGSAPSSERADRTVPSAFTVTARMTTARISHDRLPGLNFKKLLEQSGISTTVAIQSLKPTQPRCNRKMH